MITLKKILLPTDFGETCKIAVQYGRALAQAFDASLYLLNVLEQPVVPGGTPVGGYFSLTPDYRQRMEKDALQRMEQLLSSDDRSKLHAQVFTKWGSPFVEIIRFAKSEDIDLIVMGSHGIGPVAHMLLGSVAEKVVRKAPCPVLTVRHPEHEFVMPQPGTVMSVRCDSQFGPLDRRLVGVCGDDNDRQRLVIWRDHRRSLLPSTRLRPTDVRHHLQSGTCGRGHGQRSAVRWLIRRRMSQFYEHLFPIKQLTNSQECSHESALHGSDALELYRESLRSIARRRIALWVPISLCHSL